MDYLTLALSYCFPCLPQLSSPYISVNGTKYTIIKLLGEGGFSLVYLVAQKSNKDSLYALKKIRCPYGTNDESFKNAVKEIKNYHRFSNSKTPYINKSLEEAFVELRDGSQNVYILMPYFEKSLQDIINYNVLNNKIMREEEILRIFVGICKGLKIMHKFRRPGRNVQEETNDEEGDFLLPDSTEEDEPSNSGTELEESTPFAHRDIKPANVMLSAEGIPVLVDLGSCTRAVIPINNRQQALTMTDFALEHCTLPYRAPELLDVATNTTITEKTDIWSLGCLLYSCCFGYSPFEKMELEQGGSLVMAISQMKYKIPDDIKGYSLELLQIIKDCLQLDPEKRPTVDDLLERALVLHSRN